MQGKPAVEADGWRGVLPCPLIVFTARLDAGREVEHRLPAGRHAWVQVARGAVTLNGLEMVEGRGATVSDETELRIVAGDPAELLLFDLP